jgi:cytochrome bd-type quinol oxidase subunit 2
MSSKVRRGVGVAAIAMFLVTAGRAIARVGPRPDGTCATAPTCPNAHQWVALLVLAAVCVVLAFLTFAALASDRRRWPGVAVLVALAIVIVNPPGHLDSPHADWFGHSLSDGTLD